MDQVKRQAGHTEGSYLGLKDSKEGASMCAVGSPAIDYREAAYSRHKGTLVFPHKGEGNVIRTFPLS